MGYRSDVTMLFYANDAADFPMLKLWFNENVVPALQEHWGGDEEYQPKEFERGYAKGYALHFGDIKWYDSYPEVQAIESEWNKFTEAFGSDDTVGLSAERATVGEDYGDVSYDSTYHSMSLLSIVRHAEY